MVDTCLCCVRLLKFSVQSLDLQPVHILWKSSRRVGQIIVAAQQVTKFVNMDALRGRRGAVVVVARWPRCI